MEKHVMQYQTCLLYTSSNRVRHAIRTHIISYVRPDGTLVARKFEAWSNQGAYASHGHSIVAKGMGAFPQLYPCDNLECDCWTVYTNRPAAGAMRCYGIPQALSLIHICSPRRGRRQRWQPP